MRALLEFRLADRWMPLLLSEGAALLIAAVLVSQGLASLDDPSRVVLVVGLFILGAVWYDARRAEMSDRAEKREALHATLPATRLTQGLARALEPAFPLAATVLLVSLAFFLFGRGGAAADGAAFDPTWRDDLLLFLGAASWLLLLEIYQLVAVETQMALKKRGLGWLFWIGMVVTFGGPGLFVGSLIGGGKLVPYIFYLALGRPGSIALALVLTLLLGALSVSMYRNRDAMLGTC